MTPKLPPLPEWVKSEQVKQAMKAYAIAAIESAACAERDARIAELEEANEAFAKRQEWWNSRMVELERQLAELRDWIINRAMKKEQT